VRGAGLKDRLGPLGFVKKLSTGSCRIVTKEVIWPTERGFCNKAVLCNWGKTVRINVLF